jgi:hypothetical protein
LEVLAEQVAPLDSQAAIRQSVDLYPLTAFQAAFGHHEVDVGFEAQVRTGRVESLDNPNAHVGAKLIHQLTDGLGCCLHKNLVERLIYKTGLIGLLRGVLTYTTVCD